MLRGYFLKKLWCCIGGKEIYKNLVLSTESEQIEELWVVCSFCSGVGATLLVVTWQREK